MQKIIPFLWFNNNVEEAMNHYLSIFKNSRVLGVTRFGEERPGLEGSIMTASFEINGQEFMAINGGPQYQFNEAISFLVDCETQEEIDELWEKLSEGGEPGQCGWLTDKFGLSWQVVPTELKAMLNNGDPEKTIRVMKVLLQMTKIELEILKRVFGQ